MRGRTAMRSPAGVVGMGTIRSLAVAAALLAALALAASAGVERLPPPQPDHTAHSPRGGLSGFGNPLPMSPDDLAVFFEGQDTFIEVENLPQLGPLFNSRSCATCHFQPALGGSGSFINEIRIRNNTRPGPLQILASDNILRLGPQIQGGQPFFPNGVEASPLGCQITSTGCALSPCQLELMAQTGWSPGLPICDPTSADFASGHNCTAERQATPLFGFGLVEAISDHTFDEIAAHQPAALRGVVKHVTELGTVRVARFGWKDDVATLRGFAGDAYLNEVGISNPDFPNDRSTCALNKTLSGVLLDADDDPEDETDADGRADVDRFADFMRGLDAPPTLPQSTDARAGQGLFAAIGCGSCHVASIRTSFNPAAFVPPTTGGVPLSPTLNFVLRNRTIHPYSDFLLHDMGSLGDGITSGAAGPTMMRTAPLWGVRAKSRLLHDGRAEDIGQAIGFHAGQAAASRDAFQALTPAQQQQLIDFLGAI
jgi:hypothetical protein